MSAEPRQTAMRSATSDLSDGLRFLGPAGSFRFFRWLPHHTYPELWMTDPGRGNAFGRYAFERPISAAGFFSREVPAVEQARRYFVQGYNAVFKAYADEPHLTFAVGAAGFALMAVLTGSFRVDRMPMRLEISFLRRSGQMPSLSDARQRTSGRFLRTLKLSPGQSALWMGEVLKASDTEEGALGAALLGMQLRRPDVAEAFEACRRAYPAYYIGRPGNGPSIMLGFGPDDPPALLAIDQPDDGAILQEDAQRRGLLRQDRLVRDSFAR
jgi:hypothetical protein